MLQFSAPPPPPPTHPIEGQRNTDPYAAQLGEHRTQNTSFSLLTPCDWLTSKERRKKSRNKAALTDNLALVPRVRILKQEEQPESFLAEFLSMAWGIAVIVCCVAVSACIQRILSQGHQCIIVNTLRSSNSSQGQQCIIVNTLPSSISSQGQHSAYHR